MTSYRSLDGPQRSGPSRAARRTFMQPLWVGVDPRPPRARVLALQGPTEAVLKARLLPEPKHPRALATMLEALALWQGVPVRGALAVGDEEPWCTMGAYHV